MKKMAGITVGFLLHVPALAGAVYTWTDAQGQVHFGDRPPAGVAAQQQEIRPATGEVAAQGQGLRPGERALLHEIEKQERQEAAVQRKRDERAAAEARQRARQAGEDATRCANYRQKVSEYQKRLRAGCRVSTCNSWNARLDSYKRKAARVCP